MKIPALCPLDGRYSGRLGALRSVMSEAAFAACRVRVECTWFKLLADLKLPRFNPLSAQESRLLACASTLTEQDLDLIRALEFDGYQQIPPTKHDVKALEYFLRLKFKNTSLKDRLDWLHFALTSEDVNSAAYALLLADGLEKVLLPALEKLHKELVKLARKEARSVLLARTHGQPAVPTTFGKEMRVFCERLHRQLKFLKQQKISFKFGGAVGNFNAHYAAFPQVNWPRAAQKMAAELNRGRKIKLFLSPVSTQVDPRDSYAELFDNLRRIHIILLDLCRDLWHYISAGLVRQKTAAGEVGSSTMPQKVNPIDFENAEGNLQLADALLDLFSRKLPVSRLQRDLSDSTVLRNMPVAFGYALTAYQSLEKGLAKIAFDRPAARAEIQQHPEVLAEAIQTILRAAGYPRAYETLRDFTRGREITAALLNEFISGLSLDGPTRAKLAALRPETYLGRARELAEEKYD